MRDKTTAPSSLSHSASSWSNPSTRPSNNFFKDLRAPDLPSTESAFFGWLRTLLGSFDNIERFDTKRPFDLNGLFTEAIIRANGQKPETSKEIQDRWAEFTRELRQAYRPPRLVQEHILEGVASQLGGVTTLKEWETPKTERKWAGASLFDRC